MSSAKRTLDLTVLATIPFIMVLGNSMLIPILPQIKEELKITQFQVSLIITVFSISAALIIPLTGFLSDRFGRKKVIIPSLLLFGLGGLVAGLASWLLKEQTAYWTIIAGRTMQGLGAAGTASITMALIGDIFKGAAQSKALGIIEATNGLGKVASPILGTLLAMITWFTPFFTFAILCVFAVLGLIFFVKEPDTANEPPQFKAYVQSIMHIFKTEGRWLVATFFVGTISLFVLFGLLFYLSDILETRYATNGLKKGYILAIPLLAMATTSFVTGRIIKKNFVLMKALILIGLLCMAAALILMIFFQKLIALILFLVINGFGTGLVLPCINSFITGSVDKEKRGLITSLYHSVRFGGVALGPPTFGWLMTKKSWILFGSNVAIIALAFLWSIWAIRVKGQGKDGTGSQRKEKESYWKRLSLPKPKALAKDKIM